MKYVMQLRNIIGILIFSGFVDILLTLAIHTWAIAPMLRRCGLTPAFMGGIGLYRDWWRYYRCGGAMVWLALVIALHAGLFLIIVLLFFLDEMAR